jgi:hypothetical protein
LITELPGSPEEDPRTSPSSRDTFRSSGPVFTARGARHTRTRAREEEGVARSWRGARGARPGDALAVALARRREDRANEPPPRIVVAEGATATIAAMVVSSQALGEGLLEHAWDRVAVDFARNAKRGDCASEV